MSSSKNLAESIEDETNDKNPLEEITNELHSKLDIKDRKWMLSTYAKCFVGSEAVDYLIKNKKCKTRKEATNLLQLMMDAYIISHVTKDHSFIDGNYFYRFEQDEESHGKKEIHKDTNKEWTWGDLIPGSFTKESKLNLQAKIEDLNDKVITATIDEKDTFGIWPMDKYNEELLNNVHPVKWISPTPQKRYNLIAIGAGAGGLVSSAGTAGLGGKAAIIEEKLFGGDCLNSGCVPSKALLKCAKIAYNSIVNGKNYGLEIEGKLSMNFGKVMERMRKIRAHISHHDACLRFTKVYGLDVFLGRAVFISPTQIKVNNQILEFSRCVIATGGTASVPPIKGLNEIEYLTNHNLWNLTELPKVLGVIGSGPIGCEMAQAFSLFGSKVIVFNRSKRVLNKEDPDAANIVKNTMEHCGVKFICGCKFDSINYVNKDSGKKSGIKICISFNNDDNKENDKEFIVNELLIATGRKPNVNNLGLELAKVKYDSRKGIFTNDYLQTSNSNIYAVGDCCTRYQFTHMADAMARLVIRNALFFGRSKFSDLIIPWVTYTHPEIAHVGLYENDLKERNMEYDIFKYSLEENDRCICEGETEGFVKILTKKGSDTIVGCTIVSENAGDQINEITLAMQTGTGLRFIASVIHPYPTVGESIKATADMYNRTRLTPVTKALLRRVLFIRRC